MMRAFIVAPSLAPAVYATSIAASAPLHEHPPISPVSMGAMVARPGECVLCVMGVPKKYVKR